MIVPGIVARKYSNEQHYVRAVSERVKDILSHHTEVLGMPFLGRIKDMESLTEKLESGRFRKWTDIDDLYACAVVMPTLQSESVILEFLQERFDTVQVRKRGSSLKDPSVFRFDATRFIGRLKADERLPEDSPLRLVNFEVQLRSAFEHAWSAATHQLTYKPDQIDWRRLRLAAQLKASVEQLDQVLIGFDLAADAVAEHKWPEIESKKLIEKFFRERFCDGHFPEEVAPASWGRFCDNFYSLILATSETFVKDKDKERLTRDILHKLSEALLSAGPEAMPRSLTLTQYSLGLLAENNIITTPFARLTPLLTDDLFTMHPATRGLAPGFDFEMQADDTAA